MPEPILVVEACGSFRHCAGNRHSRYPRLPDRDRVRSVNFRRLSIHLDAKTSRSKPGSFRHRGRPGPSAPSSTPDARNCGSFRQLPAAACPVVFADRSGMPGSWTPQFLVAACRANLAPPDAEAIGPGGLPGWPGVGRIKRPRSRLCESCWRPRSRMADGRISTRWRAAPMRLAGHYMRYGWRGSLRQTRRMSAACSTC